MSNSNDNSTKFYDLHTKGAGFVNRLREVKPKPGSGNKHKPFWSVGIGSFRGSSDNVEYTNFDTVISGAKAREVLTQYQKEINDHNTQTIVGFTIGDIYPYTYTVNKDNQNELRCGIKGRLLSISFLKINGEMVYKYEKPQAEDKTDTPTAESNHESQEIDACPFDEQLGNTVILDTNDSLFDEKVSWLGSNGYKFNHRANAWELN